MDEAEEEKFCATQRDKFVLKATTSKREVIKFVRHLNVDKLISPIEWVVGWLVCKSVWGVMCNKTKSATHIYKQRENEPFVQYITIGI